MKRILILADYDLSAPFHYEAETVYNTGNHVFGKAICSYFSGLNAVIKTKDAVARLLRKDPDWCRRNFDVAVNYEACVFCALYNDSMRKKAALVRALGIPIYVIGAGIAARRPWLREGIFAYADAASDYLSAIYASGGAVAVRGRYSQEVCNRLGFPNVFVSGCGSIYYNGDDFQISNEKVSECAFKPAFNGYYVNDINPKWYDKYESVFIDQDIYYRALMFPSAVDTSELKKLYGSTFIKLYSTVRGIDGRLVTRQDFASWQYYLHMHGVNFSYGSRMHGNMAALISRIPCYLKVIDARTEEMADFYHLPNSLSLPFDEKRDSLYDLYAALDWTDFNQNYQRIFSRFREWLAQNDLPASFSGGGERGSCIVVLLGFKKSSRSYCRE